MTHVRGPYCLGHVEDSMAACLSPMTQDLHGSKHCNSLLHLDYAIHGSSTLDHKHALIRIVRHSSM